MLTKRKLNRKDKDVVPNFKFNVVMVAMEGMLRKRSKLLVHFVLFLLNDEVFNCFISGHINIPQIRGGGGGGFFEISIIEPNLTILKH